MKRRTPDGDLTWDLTWDNGNSGNLYVTRILLAEDGSIVVAGEFLHTINLGGKDLTNPYSGYNGPNYNTFVAGFDANRNHIWSLELHDDAYPQVLPVTLGRHTPGGII